MSFKNLFQIKRTKMVDEAAYNHQPTSTLKSIGIFILLMIIAEAIMGVIISIPTTIYIFADGKMMQATNEFISGTISEEQYSTIVEDITLNMPTWITAVTLFVYAILAATAIFFCKKFEKRTVSSMGLRKPFGAIEYAIGLLIGALMLGLSLLIPYSSGLITFKFNPAASVPLIILFFLGFVVQGASEEIFVRGYFMTSLARDIKASIAVIISSIAFSLMHLGNNGFSLIALINIILIGLFLGIYVFKRGNLWGACAIHTAWNFALGNIFGISVSGMNILPSVFIAENNSSLNIITGGAFGIEGSICTTLVILIFITLALIMKPNPNEQSEVTVEYFA